MSSEKKFRIQNGLDVAGEVFVNGINIVGADGVLNEASYQTAVQAMIDATVAQGVDQGSIDSAVTTAVSALADSAPATLDTLNELAAALGDDADFATSMTNALNTKLNAANNLSDVADAAAARSNLGLGTAATAAITSFATAAQGTKADNAATQADLTALENTIGTQTYEAFGTVTSGSAVALTSTGKVTQISSDIPDMNETYTSIGTNSERWGTYMDWDSVNNQLIVMSAEKVGSSSNKLKISATTPDPTSLETTVHYSATFEANKQNSWVYELFPNNNKRSLAAVIPGTSYIIMVNTAREKIVLFNNTGSAIVEVSQSTFDRAAEYSLHHCVVDGELHLFYTAKGVSNSNTNDNSIKATKISVYNNALVLGDEYALNSVSSNSSDFSSYFMGNVNNAYKSSPNQTKVLTIDGQDWMFMVHSSQTEHWEKITAIKVDISNGQLIFGDAKQHNYSGRTSGNYHIPGVDGHEGANGPWISYSAYSGNIVVPMKSGSSNTYIKAMVLEFASSGDLVEKSFISKLINSTGSRDYNNIAVATSSTSDTVTFMYGRQQYSDNGWGYVFGTLDSSGSWTVIEEWRPAETYSDTSNGSSTHYTVFDGPELNGHSVFLRNNSGSRAYGNEVKAHVSRMTPVSNTAQWIGIATSTQADGENVQVAIKNSSTTVLTGLSVGSTYYVQDDGSVTTTESDYIAGLALTSGKLLLEGTDLSPYATTAELAATLSQAQAYTDSGVSGVDLSGYSTTAEMNTAIANADVDLSGYSTTTEMNSAITAEVANVVDAAPAALDTLNELAAALGDDANFASTVTTSLATKADTTDLDTLENFVKGSDILTITDISGNGGNYFNTAYGSGSNVSQATVNGRYGTKAYHEVVYKGSSLPAGSYSLDYSAHPSNGGTSTIAIYPSTFNSWSSSAGSVWGMRYEASKSSQLVRRDISSGSGTFTFSTAEDFYIVLTTQNGGGQTIWQFDNDALVRTETAASIATTASEIIPAINELHSEIGVLSNAQPDLSGYSTTAEMNTAISNADVDLSGYSTTTDINAAFAAKLAEANAYSDQVVAATVDAAPAALDTLNELAAALGDDANFASTVTTSLADKASQVDLTAETTRATSAETINNQAIAILQNQVSGISTSSGSTDIEMQANVDMATNKISNLGTPTSGTDAATKAYVDSAVSSADVDLSGYSTTAEMNTAIANADPDLSGYSTTTDINAAFAAKLAEANAYSDQVVAATVDAAPAALDTLNELAAALGDDANFASTVTTSLATKADTTYVDTQIAGVTVDTSGLATAAQGAKADTAVQPEDFGVGFNFEESTVLDLSSFSSTDITEDNRGDAIENIYSSGSVYGMYMRTPIYNDTHYVLWGIEADDYQNDRGIYAWVYLHNGDFVRKIVINPEEIGVNDGNQAEYPRINLTLNGDYMVFTETISGPGTGGKVKIYDLRNINDSDYGLVAPAYSADADDIQRVYGLTETSVLAFISTTGNDLVYYKVRLYDTTVPTNWSVVSEYDISTTSGSAKDMTLIGNKLSMSDGESIELFDISTWTSSWVTTWDQVNAYDNHYSQFAASATITDDYVIFNSRSNDKIGKVTVLNASDGSFVRNMDQHTFNAPFVGELPNLDKHQPRVQVFGDMCISQSVSNGTETGLHYTSHVVRKYLHAWKISTGELIQSVQYYSIDRYTSGGSGNSDQSPRVVVLPNGFVVDTGGIMYHKGTYARTGTIPTSTVNASVVATQSYVDTAVASADIDLSGYSTTAEMNTAIAAIPATDLTPYSTTAEMNSAITVEVANVVDAAPAALDTLNELAAALGDDANFASTVTSSIATKADDAATTAALATKADDASTTAALATKADASSVSSIEDFLNGNAGDGAPTVESTIMSPVNSHDWGQKVIVHDDVVLVRDNTYMRIYSPNDLVNHLELVGASDSWEFAYDPVTKILMAGNAKSGSNQNGFINFFHLSELIAGTGPIRQNYVHTLDSGATIDRNFGGSVAFADGKFYASKYESSFGATPMVHVWNASDIAAQMPTGGSELLSITPITITAPPAADNRGYWGYDMAAGGNYFYVFDMFYSQVSTNAGAIFVYNTSDNQLVATLECSNDVKYFVAATENYYAVHYHGVTPTKTRVYQAGTNTLVAEFEGVVISGDRMDEFGNHLSFGFSDSVSGDKGVAIYDTSDFSKEPIKITTGSEHHTVSSAQKLYAHTKPNVQVYDVSSLGGFSLQDDLEALVSAETSAREIAIAAETSAREIAITSAISTASADATTKADQAEVDAKAYADQVVASTIDAAPAALDTLNELAAALGDDANFASTVTSSIATKADDAATTAALAGKADASAVATSAQGALADTAVQPEDFGAGIVQGAGVSDWSNSQMGNEANVGTSYAVGMESEAIATSDLYYVTATTTSNNSNGNINLLVWDKSVASPASDGWYKDLSSSLPSDAYNVTHLEITDEYVFVGFKVNYSNDSNGLLAIKISDGTVYRDFKSIVDAAGQGGWSSGANGHAWKFDIDDKYIAIVDKSESNVVIVVDYTTGQWVRNYTFTGARDKLEVAVDSGKMLVSGYRSNDLKLRTETAELVDVASGSVLHTLTPQHAQQADPNWNGIAWGGTVLLSSDYAVVGSMYGTTNNNYVSGKLDVFDVSTGSHIVTLSEGYNTGNNRFAYGLDRGATDLYGSYLVATTSDDKAYVYDLSTSSSDALTVLTLPSKMGARVVVSSTGAVFNEASEKTPNGSNATVINLIVSSSTPLIVDDSLFATKAYVDSGVAGVDLSGYSTTAEMNTAISNADVDLSGYSTTTDINAAFAAKLAEANAYSDQVVASTVDAAPAALDTLNELAAALGDDANFASTVTTSLASKADDAATTAALALKANSSDLVTLQTNVEVSGSSSNSQYYIVANTGYHSPDYPSSGGWPSMSHLANVGAIYLYDKEDLSADPIILTNNGTTDPNNLYPGFDNPWGEQLGKSIHVTETHLFASNGMSYNFAVPRLYVWDLSDLSAEPTVLTHPDWTSGSGVIGHALGYEPEQIQTYGNNLFVSSHLANKFYVYDISDLSQAPTVISNPDTGNTNNHFSKSIQVDEDSKKLYVGAPNGTSGKFFVYDLENLQTAPIEIVSPNWARGFGISLNYFGNKLVVGDQDQTSPRYDSIYVYDTLNINSTPTQYVDTNTGYGNNGSEFGRTNSSVFIDSRGIVIGAPRHGPATFNPTANEGAVFVIPMTDGVLGSMVQLSDSGLGLTSNDWLGTNVSSQDGSIFASYQGRNENDHSGIATWSWDDLSASPTKLDSIAEDLQSHAAFIFNPVSTPKTIGEVVTDNTAAIAAEAVARTAAIAATDARTAGISVDSDSNVALSVGIEMGQNNIKDVNDVYAARGFIDHIESNDLKVQTGTVDFEGSIVNFGSSTITGSGFGNATKTEVDQHLNIPTANAGEFVKWTGTDYEWTDLVSGRLATDQLQVASGGSIAITGPGGTFDFQDGIVMLSGSDVRVDTPTDVGQAANKGYVDGVVAATVDAAPAALDTLNELAAALGDDANFASTITNSLATKANTADVATAAQGAKADSALQPGDAVSLTVDNSEKLDGQQSSHFRIDIYDINGNIVN